MHGMFLKKEYILGKCQVWRYGYKREWNRKWKTAGKEINEVKVLNVGKYVTNTVPKRYLNNVS